MTRKSESFGGGTNAVTPGRLVLFLTALAYVVTTPNVAAAQVPTRAPLPVVTAPPPGEAPHLYDTAELQRIISPIALYPDPLLAQVLAAATFPSQIPEANQWLDDHRGLRGQQLVDALADEQVSWNPSVQALVAFPTVLQMMATSMPWTWWNGCSPRGNVPSNAP